MIKPGYFILLVSLFFMACTDNRTDYQKASDFFNEKKYDKAAYYLEKTIKGGIDDNATVFKKITIAYIKLGKYQEAEKYIKKALTLDKENEDLIKLYAKVLLKRKMYYKAFNLIKMLPDSFDKYQMMINLNLEVHNVKVINEYLNKALDLIDNEKAKNEFKYKIALKILDLDEFCIEKNEIFKSLENTHKKDIGFLKNYYKALACEYKNKFSNRSIIARYNESKVERTAKKIEILDRLIKNEKNVFYYNELAQIYIDKNDFLNARKFILLSKKINYSQDRLLYLEAKIDFEKDRYELVVEKLEKYIKNHKGDINALKMLAKAYYLTGKNRKAVKYYKMLDRLERYNKDNLFKLEELYEKTGDKKSLNDIKYQIKYFNKRFYK